jgi:hypothetical protein
LPVSACVMTNATPDGAAMGTGGEVGVAGGVPGPGRPVDGSVFGDGVSLRAGTGGATEATVVGVTTAVAVGTTVAVGDGDADGPVALRWCVQPARATSAATSAAATAQHPARSCTMPAVASLPALPALPALPPPRFPTHHNPGCHHDDCSSGKSGGGVGR